MTGTLRKRKLGRTTPEAPPAVQTPPEPSAPPTPPRPEPAPVVDAPQIPQVELDP